MRIGHPQQGDITPDRGVVSAKEAKRRRTSGLLEAARKAAATRRRTSRGLEAARRALELRQTRDTYQKVDGLTATSSAMTQADTVWGSHLTDIGYPVDFSTLQGKGNEILASQEFADLVAALTAAIESAGYNPESNDKVNLALETLRLHFGLAPESAGALLALAVGAVDRADDAATAKAAEDLKLHDTYTNELESYLDYLQGVETDLAGPSKAGGKGDPGKGQAVVEFRSYEVKDGQVVSRADSTLPQGVKVQGEDAGSTMAVANLSQVRQEIAEVRRLIEEAEAQRAQLARDGSPAGQWQRQESIAQALGRILPNATQSTYGNPLTDFGYGLDPKDSSAANCLSQVLGFNGGGAIHSAHELTSKEIVEAAQANGLDARRVNGATADYLRTCVDNGIPCMILGSEQGEPRWLVVTGYRCDAAGNVVEWTVSDPSASGGQRTMTASELTQFWSNEPWDDVADTRNLMIAMAPAGSEQASHLPPEDLAAEAPERLDAMEELARLAYAMRDDVPPFDANGSFIGVHDWLRRCIGKGILDVQDGKLVKNATAPKQFGSIADIDPMVGSLGDALKGLGYDLDKIKAACEFWDPGATGDLRDRVEYKRQYGQLFVDGISPEDVEQNQLGDCYLLATLSALADSNPDLIRDMIRDNGDGTYRVRFYDFWGRAVYITVDSDLPMDGTNLVYGTGTNRRELWPAIIEKAYAKWHGGYGDIEGGYSGTAYRQLTGDRVTISLWPKATAWDTVRAAARDNQPMTADTYGNKKKYVDTGIVKGHVYTILDAYERDGKKYVLLRNPWGGTEWGDDGVDDGTFEMPWEEFQKLFEGIHFHGGL